MNTQEQLTLIDNSTTYEIDKKQNKDHVATPRCRKYIRFNTYRKI